jgi:hypothetical protein
VNVKPGRQHILRTDSEGRLYRWIANGLTARTGGCLGYVLGTLALFVPMAAELNPPASGADAVPPLVILCGSIALGGSLAAVVVATLFSLLRSIARHVAYPDLPDDPTGDFSDLE